MTMPHTCRCVTCGAEGIIVPNPFDGLPRAYGGTGLEVKPAYDLARDEAEEAEDSILP